MRNAANPGQNIENYKKQANTQIELGVQTLQRWVITLQLPHPTLHQLTNAPDTVLQVQYYSITVLQMRKILYYRYSVAHAPAHCCDAIFLKYR